MLTGININKETKTLQVTDKSFWGKITAKAYAFNDLYFTYRKRYVYSYRHRFVNRSQPQKNVCIIDCAEKTIAVLEPDEDGWTDVKIRNLVGDLIAAGIKRITEKYNDNEVELF
jgi:hypothetical protein